MDCRGICIQPKQQPIQIPGPGTTPTTGSPNKADRPESAFGGPMSAQNPDPKRLISDDPAGSPGDVGGRNGYAEGFAHYAKGIDKGFNAQPEGGHTAEYKRGFNENYQIGREDAQLKAHGQLSSDYLRKINGDSGKGVDTIAGTASKTTAATSKQQQPSSGPHTTAITGPGPTSDEGSKTQGSVREFNAKGSAGGGDSSNNGGASDNVGGNINNPFTGGVPSSDIGGSTNNPAGTSTGSDVGGSSNNPALGGDSSNGPRSDVSSSTNSPKLGLGTSNNNPSTDVAGNPVGTSNNNPSTDVGGSSKDGGTLGGFSAQRSASSDIGTSSDNNLFSGSSEVGSTKKKSGGSDDSSSLTGGGDNNPFSTTSTEGHSKKKSGSSDSGGDESSHSSKGSSDSGGDESSHSSKGSSDD